MDAENICPNCKVDVKAFKQRKKEFFESEYGEHLKPFRKEMSRKGMFWGAVCGLFFYIFSWFLITLLSNEPPSPLEIISQRNELSLILLGFLILYTMVGLVSYRDFFTKKSKEEKRLLANFNSSPVLGTDILHPE